MRPSYREVAILSFALLISGAGCAALFSGTTYREGASGYVCRHNSGLVVLDGVLGSLALVGTLAAVVFSQLSDSFYPVAALGVAGTAGHFASAASTDVGSCRTGPLIYDEPSAVEARPNEPWVRAIIDAPPQAPPNPRAPLSIDIAACPTPWDCESKVSQLVGKVVRVLRHDGGETVQRLSALRGHALVFADSSQWNIEDVRLVEIVPAE